MGVCGQMVLNNGFHFKYTNLDELWVNVKLFDAIKIQSLSMNLKIEEYIKLQSSAHFGFK